MTTKAKSKTAPNPAPPAAAPQPATAAPAAAAPAPVGYSVSSWGGHPNYQCSACPFSTLAKGVIESHQEAHTPKPGIRGKPQAQSRKRFEGKE